MIELTSLQVDLLVKVMGTNSGRSMRDVRTAIKLLDKFEPKIAGLSDSQVDPSTVVHAFDLTDEEVSFARNLAKMAVSLVNMKSGRILTDLWERLGVKE